MAYQIEIDYSPAYELLVSFYSYTKKNLSKGLTMGSEWKINVTNHLNPDFVTELHSSSAFELSGIDLLVNACPHKDTTNGFLNWLEELKANELFEIIAPQVEAIPTDILERRRHMVHLLREWDTQYFSSLEPAIFAGLAHDAEAKRDLKNHLTPEDLFEEATNGMRQNPTPELSLIRLIPQFHLRPSNSSHHYKHMIVCFYACDALPSPSHQPKDSLLRLMTGLSDPSRLLLLKHIEKQSRSFTELVQVSGLAKSTVHHHLVALRAAGLVRVTAVGNSDVTYSLRGKTLDRVTDQLKEFLQGE